MHSDPELANEAWAAMQQQQQQQAHPSASAGPHAPAFHGIPSMAEMLTALAPMLAQITDAQVRGALQNAGQATSALQLAAIQSLGSLRTFDGQGPTAGAAAREWVVHAERYFQAREAAMGQQGPAADRFRVLDAGSKLAGPALQWHEGLANQPTTWAEFRTALLTRFNHVPAEQVREGILRRFVDDAERVRTRLNAEGIARYSHKFLQLIADIADTRMTQATKRTMYARGLPQRYAEYVLTEDAKPAPPQMHELVPVVLSRATMHQHASAAASASSSSGAHRSDAMEVDHIALAAVNFGVSHEEAGRYFDSPEGWAPHDTAPTHRGADAESALVERVLAALRMQSGGRGQLSGSSDSRRRNVPSGVKKEVPEPLASERRAAGLCIKCGVAKYEPGGKGHNSVTCRAAADKTTSVAEGRRKANF